MASPLGSIVIEMAVNLARLRSDFGQAASISQTRLREIQRSTETTVRQISSVGRLVQQAFGAIGIGVGLSSIAFSLKNAASEAIKFGDEMAKAAAKTGVTGSVFSELAYAARQNDVALESLSKGFKTFQQRVSEAGSGLKSAQDVFRALGIEFESFRNKSPEDQFEQIAEQISRLKDPADRARAAVELFGRAGADLLPLFQDGAKGVRALREEAVRTGRALTDDQIKRLADADLAIKNLTASWQSFARELTANVAPALTGVLDKLTTLGQINLGKIAASALGGPANFIQTTIRQVNSAEDAARRQRNLQAISRSPNLKERGEDTSATAPPGFRPDIKTGKDDALAGLSEISIYSREVYNFANEQAKAFEELSKSVNEDLRSNVQGLTNETSKMLGTLTEQWRDSTSQWTAFAEQAASNITDAFAQFLFDPFKDGLRGMVAGFVDAIRQMLAQYLALQAITGLGGALAGSSNKFISGIGGFLQGAKASGGPVSPGAWLVGEKGPEIMVTRSSGTVIPNSAMGGNVTLNYSIDARGGDADRLMAMLPAMLKRTKDETVAAMIDLQRRGRFA